MLSVVLLFKKKSLCVKRSHLSQTFCSFASLLPHVHIKCANVPSPALEDEKRDPSDLYWPLFSPLALKPQHAAAETFDHINN